MREISTVNANTLYIIIEGATFILSVVVILWRMAYRDGEHAKVHEAMEKRMNEVEKTLSTRGTRIDDNTNIIGTLKTDIGWIKDALKDIKRALRLKDEEGE